jgi:hypothetical protein
LEDFIPLDLRLEIVVRRGTALLRLFPGSIERPVADVERTVLLADAVDKVLLPQQSVSWRRHILGLRNLTRVSSMSLTGECFGQRLHSKCVAW